MKAIYFEKHGGLDTLKYGDLPDPVPTQGQALVQVKAVALNHLDIWVRRGWKGLSLKLPHITGSDIAGVVTTIVGDSNFKPSDRVVINPGVLLSEDAWSRQGLDSLSPHYRILGEHLPGGMAEQVCVPLENLHKLPDEVSFEDGAAPLLVGTTCWRMLFKVGALTDGQSVLVVGSGGGVNSMAVQLARAAGATVYCLAGTAEKYTRALEIGAHEVINYSQSPDWHRDIIKLTDGRGVDLVIDNVGEQTLHKSMRAVAIGGKIVTVGNTTGPKINIDNRLLFTKQIALIGSTMGSRQDFLDMLSFIRSNDISPVIDCVRPLSEGIKMIERMEKGEHFGKIVLTP